MGKSIKEIHEEKKRLASELLNHLDIAGHIEELIFKKLNLPSPLMQNISIRVAKEEMSSLLCYMIKIYTKTYTLEELKAVLKFYKSDVGSRYLKKSKELSCLMFSKTSEWADDVMAKARKEYDKTTLKKAAEEGINWRRYVNQRRC